MKIPQFYMLYHFIARKIDDVMRQVATLGP